MLKRIHIFPNSTVLYRLGHQIRSNSRVALPSPCPTTKLLLQVILSLDVSRWAPFFAAARASLRSISLWYSVSCVSPFHSTCSWRVTVFCFSRATLSIFKSKRPYVTFLAEERKIGARQWCWFPIALACGSSRFLSSCWKNFNGTILNSKVCQFPVKGHCLFYNWCFQKRKSNGILKLQVVCFLNERKRKCNEPNGRWEAVLKNMMNVAPLNCRIPRLLIASHWTRVASTVIYLVLQSTPTHVMAGLGYSAFALQFSEGNIFLQLIEEKKWNGSLLFNHSLLKTSCLLSSHTRAYCARVLPSPLLLIVWSTCVYVHYKPWLYLGTRKDRSYSACLLLEWTYFYAFGDELHLRIRWHQPTMLCIRLVPREILWLGELSAEQLHHSVKTLPILDVACSRGVA